MDITYYLPEILFGVMALAAAIWLGGVVIDLLRGKRGEAGCIHCRGTAVKESYGPCLFLLPIHFGETYEDSEDYLLHHMRPIYGKEQIPTGMRACWLEVYRCERCDKRQVKITDFLDVRGEENIKGSYVFSYEAFRPLVEQWREMSVTNPSVKTAEKGIHGKADSHISRRGQY